MLRPSTRTPVLVCNPTDHDWFDRIEALVADTVVADLDAVVDQQRTVAVELAVVGAP